MTHTADVLVVGAGMGGAAVGYHLARRGLSVRLLERERHAGYHSTGRSAALFSETFGPDNIRRLSRASRQFLMTPPEGFSEHALLTPRGLLSMGRPGQEEMVSGVVSAGRAEGVAVEKLDEIALRQVVPILRPGVFVTGAHETGAMDIDVHALHWGYLRWIRRCGGAIHAAVEVTGAQRSAGIWVVRDARGERWEAPLLVNAAGAWADEFARRAGVATVGLVPRRRTALTLDLPSGIRAERWPLTGDLDNTFYFKPDAGHLLLSPADATAVPAQDVQPEIEDVARVIERFMAVTTVGVDEPVATWAGLRSFVADGEPVLGPDSDAEGFLWCAGQGGYGIHSADAMGRLVAVLGLGEALPAELTAFGVSPSALAPGRPALVRRSA